MLTTIQHNAPVSRWPILSASWRITGLCLLCSGVHIGTADRSPFA